MLFILFAGLNERIYLLDECLIDRRWGFLEMYKLLNKDVVRFCISGNYAPSQGRGKVTSYLEYEDPELLVPLLISRCPVS